MEKYTHVYFVEILNTTPLNNDTMKTTITYNCYKKEKHLCSKCPDFPYCDLERVTKEIDLPDMYSITNPWISIPSQRYGVTPYKCPICNGTGKVPSGFYTSTSGITTSNDLTEPCKSCVKGIVWG